MAERQPIEIQFLREVADQADAVADTLYPNKEKATGNFSADLSRRTPYLDAIGRLNKIAQGARLIIAATEKGLQLPNGEMFKIPLTGSVVKGRESAEEDHIVDIFDGVSDNP